MKLVSNGIEQRLDELNERLARLNALRTRKKEEFDADPFLRDIVERNLEVAAQCVIDICHRIISMEKSRKPADSNESILLAGELGILAPELATKLAPIAGFRNVLVHEYIAIDWNIVYRMLDQLEDLQSFYHSVRKWLLAKTGP